MSGRCCCEDYLDGPCTCEEGGAPKEIKAMSEEKPVGMYGETSKVQVPDCGAPGLTICRQGDSSVWIEDAATGEGAEFHDELFYPFLRRFYDEHF